MNGFAALLLYSPRTAPASFWNCSFEYFRFWNRSDSISTIFGVDRELARMWYTVRSELVYAFESAPIARRTSLYFSSG